MDATDTYAVRLQTDRLLLRPIVESDAESFFALNNDPEVSRYLGEPPSSLEELRAGIRDYPDYKDYGFGRLACELRSTGEMIGFCGLKKLPELNGEVDLGYRLARAHWGKGLASEACRAVLELGFGQLGLSRIIGLVIKENLRSVRVLEKMGMQLEGEIEYWGEPCLLYARSAKSAS